MFKVKQFIRAYAECALWSSCGPEDEPHACENLDDIFGIEDISPECRASMRADCLDFIRANFDDLQEYCARMKCEQWSGEARAGHDFWLTRNGHGADLSAVIGCHEFDAAESARLVALIKQTAEFNA